MENNLFCQSCSMPIDDPALRGTEKNGSLSTEYCRYCYADGAFVNPEMSLDEMTVVVKAQMEKRGLDNQLIQKAMNSLPHLRRWTSLRPEMAPLK